MPPLDVYISFDATQTSETVVLKTTVDVGTAVQSEYAPCGIIVLPCRTMMEPSGAASMSEHMPSKSRPTVSGSKYLQPLQKYLRDCIMLHFCD